MPVSKSRAKFLIFIAGLFGALAALLIIIVGVSQIVAVFQQGADPASIFRGAKLIIPEEEQARWLQDAPDTGTTPSQAQREELIAAYWQAWLAYERSQQTGNPADLPTYWAGPAFKQIQADESTAHQVESSGHKLRLTFFSDDGTIATFQDRRFTLRHIIAENAVELTTSASVVMTLDNGYWRIRAITFAYDGISPEMPPPVSTPGLYR